MGWVVPFVIFGLCLVFLSTPIMTAKRGKAFAEKHSLMFLNEELPYELPEELLENLPASLQVKECLFGVRYGERVVSFSYAVGCGRQKLWRSAVALERRHPELPINAPRFGRVYRSGRWVLETGLGLFGNSLSEKQILKEWDALRTTDALEALAADADARRAENVVIRPRHESLH